MSRSVQNAIDQRNRAIWRAEREAARRPSQRPARISNASSRQPYVPVELAPSSRTGAMDAFALPSLLLNKRTRPRRSGVQTSAQRKTGGKP